MAFFEVFSAVLTANLMAWFIERYIKNNLNKVADNIENKIKRRLK